MILVKPSYRIETTIDRFVCGRIEQAGRTCYKSMDKATDDSADAFVRMIVKNGHESVLEHQSITVRFVVDRGVSHELVRHRLAAYSQESTRYCNYKGGVTFVIPPWVEIEPGEYKRSESPARVHNGDYIWFTLCSRAEVDYMMLLDRGWSPQQARSVLPNSLKTEIAMTANLREWRHVLRLRTDPKAHPQMREVMVPLLVELKSLLPPVFEDIE